MPGPLQGIRVVELGFWVAGPAAGGIMADWGADVVKIEPPDGDPFRGLFTKAAGIEVPMNPPFELDNRGKRSIALNLATAEGRRIARQLITHADVFVSNVRLGGLERMGLDYATVRADNPGLVYCSISGYGPDGEDRDRAAYDIGAFWSRGGVGLSLVPAGGEPPQQRGAMGDHVTAVSAVSAICGALVARARTGEGQFVTTSLLRNGLYMLGWDANIRLRFGYIDSPYDRFGVPNPLVNSYRAGDGRWLWLLGLQGDRHWPDLLRALDRPDLLDDPRFSNIRVRRENNGECVRILDAAFAAKPLDEWGVRLDRANMWWAPVRSLDEAIDDPQLRANGGVVKVPVADGEADMLASPADFHGTPWRPTMPVPECGQHSEEVLLELGYDWEAITQLKESGAVP
jgi:crotonobetainyl-CoA:carnitine CoA-transferase CaiB-like acyl-CoA transferase